MNFSTIDLTVFAGYIIIMMLLGIYLSRKKKGENVDTQDYFLAGKALPWWAVGGSLIASNISAEQFIGMSGSGYVMGMAIATYELMAAATLIIIAKFFLPIFIDKGIYTMPQFLEERYDKRVRSLMAVFWVMLFVFVNITSVLYLGGLALETIMGVPMMAGVIGLAIYAATFSIFGGLRAVVWTDVVQVVVLIFGGLLTSYLVLDALGGGFFAGLGELYTKAPDKFDMILEKGHDSYMDLPGISVLIGGMWIANIYYWGNNQYIIQRALGAKNIREAQKGTAFAAFIKVLLPIIVVIPGIAAFVLEADIARPDQAYPWVLSNYVMVGFKGLALAALIAAIGSSLSSMVNSVSTIFTLDIYKPAKGITDQSDATESHLVKVGKIVAGLSLVVGVLVAPMLGGLDQAFQFIQEYTGFISPGVVAIFIFGLFWKRTSANAALAVVFLSFFFSLGMKILFEWMPFIDRMGVAFLLSAIVLVTWSLIENKSDDPKGIHIEKGLFNTDMTFNLSAFAICGILAAIYALMW